MATEDLVTEQFQFLGVNVDNDVLTKCVNLCEEHNIDAETFVELWMAFSLTDLNGAAPSLERLELLERKEFSKRVAADRRNAASLEASRSTGSGVTIYGASASFQSDNEVFSNYVVGLPKIVKIEGDQVTISQHELCPASYSPNIGKSAKYTSRKNAGLVVHSFGEDDMLKNIAKPNAPVDVLNLNISQVPNGDGEIYTKALFGFELLHAKATTFTNHMEYLSQYIMKKAGISESTSVRHKTQAEVFVSGRIECDADARLNPKSVVLRGTWKDSLSQSVPVDLDNLKQFSLFPGQVVVMRGVNPRGDKFVAHEVYTDAALPIPDNKADIINCLKGTLSMVIAAGPYTTSENLLYEPLKDLITYVNTHRPNLVIMTGPFIDSEHDKVKDNTMAETYKSFFEKLIDSLREIQTTSPYTKFYIVSSVRDAFHMNVYPTPPYSCRRRPQNVHFVPDPCTLSVNGVLVSITATDVLMHIGQEEISHGAGSDKLSRVCRYVLSQQSMYPLWPCPSSLPLDTPLWDAHAQLTHTPHILVMPSHFRYFVKEINGCVVVNPDRLCKGSSGGTFARVLVNGDLTNNNIAAQILRI